jgi:tRNA(fMet)-specific endonuclease VapC
MKAYSLDCAALIAAERQDPDMLRAIDRWSEEGAYLSISSIALAEWCVGRNAVKDAGRRSRADRFFEAFIELLPIQHLTTRDAIRTGEIAGLLRSQGKTVALPDALIACQALRRNLTVVTGNIRHFSKIPGLEVVDSKEKAPDVEDAEGQEG